MLCSVCAEARLDLLGEPREDGVVDGPAQQIHQRALHEGEESRAGLGVHCACCKYICTSHKVIVQFYVNIFDWLMIFL